MAYTQLSPTATPGRRYSFVAKFAATGTHIGSFTALSVMALPGPIRSFLAKTAVVVVVPPVIVPVVPSGGGGGGGYAYTRKDDEEYFKYQRAEAHRIRVLRDDQDVMELIVIIVKSGIL